MTESEQYAQTIIDQTYEQLQPTIVRLSQRLALTFGIPLLLMMIANILLQRLLINSLPATTGALTGLLVNMAVFYVSWRLTDTRWGGTALFLLYAAFSRERRELKQLLAQTPAPNGMTLHSRADDLAQSARDLTQAVTRNTP
jgi:hypothetical protein